MSQKYTCCGYNFSLSNYRYHQREIHTFKNCVDTCCDLCKEIFKNPSKHKKCFRCRNLQKSLNTNTLIEDTYVYNDNKKYIVKRGFAEEICNIYTCDKDINCSEHNGLTKTTCRNIKCNNMYLENGLSYCEKCRMGNHKSKNKLRQNLIDLKIKLGGKCVNCSETRLYVLEIDHIDPSKKTKQITKMTPQTWDEEIKFVQLLDGNCHRIKSVNEIKDKYKDNPMTRCKKSKNKSLQYSHEIKRQIGKCQICNWTHENKVDLCSVLEYDHIDKNDKKNQVSNLTTRHDIYTEISKCRVICRNCHQITTALQLGGKTLELHLDKKEMEELRNVYLNDFLNKIYNDELKNIINESEKIPIIQEVGRRKRVCQIDIDTNNILKIYDTLSDASNFTNIPVTAIFNANSCNKPMRGFIWKYYEDIDIDQYIIEIDVDPDTLKSETKIKPRVIQKDVNNNIIETFSTLKEASLKVNVDASNIYRACNNRLRKAAGFYWSFD
jgi:hypothetical protein